MNQKINALAIGSSYFISSLDELKGHLICNLEICSEIKDEKYINNFDVLLVHEDRSKDLDKIKSFEQNIIRILFVREYNKIKAPQVSEIKIPLKFSDINKIISDTIIKKKFYENSSIKIKSYILNKNERKLIKDKKFIILTEKEIQLLEIFLKNKNPISKKKIMKQVWNYSTEADTHTVETHIYRLRKKIQNNFSDEKFILNNKDGYLI